MRLIVELYDKVSGEYHAYGISTSSPLRSIPAVDRSGQTIIAVTLLRSDIKTGIFGARMGVISAGGAGAQGRVGKSVSIPVELLSRAMRSGETSAGGS
jgi:hypothetical protein